MHIYNHQFDVDQIWSINGFTSALQPWLVVDWGPARPWEWPSMVNIQFSSLELPKLRFFTFPSNKLFEGTLYFQSVFGLWETAWHSIEYGILGPYAGLLICCRPTPSQIQSARSCQTIDCSNLLQSSKISIIPQIKLIFFRYLNIGCFSVVHLTVAVHRHVYSA